ncbi:tRNA (N6-isopentenyl adenosine(37)-C2)-methylthiotransferase MiaB [Candidatus Desantisbacteria bacterium CG_4_10_14_0_8_um_filter_48_22]|uniref:tRNA-2-methylthio-N(6)-dimethylallyladenosine synthase n=1 Tax=Candidatus Desantisbacteria bacterium CG_4_10_14_0_8_um_filter_48_22 TaxID=1974543 RepID=A0A2M7SE38_9BACT|nr:MAG: tRNA (N6-isopentenyl adenosine(37)-C2)-methylthiotransferase MiaB [Candidatus Desantisbacteria bacterium CG1_02_49_89]PIV57473.1 MAG: tRNA (N6-isopentenyl adenosine(37)-C2)-methylthiotransferase MiaB [Candidatus Desantisbacteria bacterium CG02_land_8_20_14_3_00_49_13]PIZ17744.1 MAG: tRNA (N6-isopentenyl adenosine(37)-C2)-methylthiotransferase MiaB [Candidatus Desantisbacteria bacterium CG_4_10_14_0_8_um_filter_48_22]PJB27896.1 MAG: tRNA (N6-isopentenyl adenosine(37)-C2)-methylthiotransfe
MKFYIKTFGCQMNEYDSQCIAGQLVEHGFRQIKDADEADIIIFNTCSVREHAVQRFYTILSETKKLKEKKPGLLVGVCGCLAEQEKTGILNRFPWVQVVIGPGNIGIAGDFVKKAIENKSRIVETGKFNPPHLNPLPPVERKNMEMAYVPIIRGCDNFCSYCVVPHLRGREQSRPADEIIAEAERVAAGGFKEIMLLGQNVCSYKDSRASCVVRRASKSNDFVELLKEIEKIKGIEKISYMTAHPKDMTLELIEAIAASDKMEKEFHLPLQSGSDRILEAMNRGYTRKHYLDLIKTIKDRIPGAVFSTDIIVGFPGETEEDFLQTLEIVKGTRFNNAFMFKYSDRPNTKALGMQDKVSEEEKESRLKRLISLNSENIKKNRNY